MRGSERRTFFRTGFGHKPLLLFSSLLFALLACLSHIVASSICIYRIPSASLLQRPIVRNNTPPRLMLHSAEHLTDQHFTRIMATPGDDPKSSSSFIQFKCLPPNGSLNRWSSVLTREHDFPGAQAMLYGAGVKDEKTLKEAAQVGISTVWWEGNPCK